MGAKNLHINRLFEPIKVNAGIEWNDYRLT